MNTCCFLTLTILFAAAEMLRKNNETMAILVTLVPLKVRGMADSI
jgi:hypothetical protein